MVICLAREYNSSAMAGLAHVGRTNSTVAFLLARSAASAFLCSSSDSLLPLWGGGSSL